jgi:hypothetical protein
LLHFLPTINLISVDSQAGSPWPPYYLGEEDCSDPTTKINPHVLFSLFLLFITHTFKLQRERNSKAKKIFLWLD